jgi:hypothetical protein
MRFIILPSRDWANAVGTAATQMGKIFLLATVNFVGYSARETVILNLILP